jgi:hypothetical protein
MQFEQEPIVEMKNFKRQEVHSSAEQVKQLLEQGRQTELELK